jgi:hypothetical protein
MPPDPYDEAMSAVLDIITDYVPGLHDITDDAWVAMEGRLTDLLRAQAAQVRAPVTAELAAEVAVLRAQRDAALEALRGDEQAVWKVAYAHDILAAGVQPEPDND